jgi:hypothetical protein
VTYSKTKLVDTIMRHYGYDKLDTNAQARLRSYYERMSIIRLTVLMNTTNDK